jgi:hypothetical protein
MLLATQQEEFTRVGQTFISSVGTSYDPMLERRVGTRVVFELDRDGSVCEYVGILKEYSRNFIEVLDVDYPSRTAVKLDRGMGRLLSKGVVCDLDGDSLEIRNGSPEPVTIDTVVAAEEIKLDETIPAGDTWRTELPPGYGEVEIRARTVRRADLLIPRTRAVVRHQSERIKPR